MNFKLYILLSVLILQLHKSNAQCDTKLLLEKPIIEKRLIQHKLLYTSTSDSILQIKIVIKDKSDSILLDRVIQQLPLSETGQGILYIDTLWKFSKNEKLIQQCLQSTGNLPVNDYYIQMVAYSANGCMDTLNNYWQIDSNLIASSNLYISLENAIINELNKKPVFLQQIKKIDSKVSKEDASQKLQDAIEVIIKKTLQSNYNYLLVEKLNTNTYQFYIDNALVANLKILPELIIKNIIQNRIDNMLQLFTNGLTKDNERLESINTKIAKEIKEKTKETYLIGKVGIGNYYSNEQYEYSAQLPFYQEVNGSADMKIFGIPLNIDGYFTTQDLHRNIKSSFLRVNFDVQKAKQDLVDIGKAYEELLTDKKSQVAGVANVYGTYTGSLENKKKQILLDANHFIGNKKQLVIDSLQKMLSNYNIPIDTNAIIEALLKKANDKADSNDVIQNKIRKVKEWQEKMEKTKKEIESRLTQAKEAEEKIKKYEAMVSQYQQALHFDTAFVKNKVDSVLSTNKDITVNSLQRKAKQLLQEKGISKISKRLNYFGIGIINKEESYYTLSSQTIKGAGFGFNMGRFETDITAGRTEYIGRDGTVDKYNCLALKNTMHIGQDSKIGIVYYGYQLSKNQIDSQFFNPMRSQLPSIALPKPSNIISIVSEATLFRRINFNAEVANSNLFLLKYLDKQNNNILLQNFAQKYELNTALPFLKIEVGANFESVGANFENNTLLFIRKNFMAYGVVINGEAMHNYIHYKASITELVQNISTTQATNRKLGFELRTNSKQYPNITISYKPFSSFKAVNDTFLIQQRPMFGEVFTAKISYQYKKNNFQHRWNIIGNRNKTISDTSNYLSELYQLSYTINYKTKWLGNMNCGYTNSPLAEGKIQQNKFIAFNGNYLTTHSVNWSLSADLSFTNNQLLNKIGYTIGNSFFLPKYKIRITCNGRYMHYLNSENLYKNIYSSFVGLQYQFSKKPLFVKK